MTDKDKIRAEVERLNSLVPYDRKDRHDDGLHDAYHAILQFINSLPEEVVSEDLEEVAKQNQIKYVFDNNVNNTTLAELKYIGVSNFKDGAQWKEQHLMEKAVDGKVTARFPLASEPLYIDAQIFVKYAKNLNEGDHVKVIIIKED